MINKKKSEIVKMLNFFTNVYNPMMCNSTKAMICHKLKSGKYYFEILEDLIDVIKAKCPYSLWDVRNDQYTFYEMLLLKTKLDLNEATVLNKNEKEVLESITYDVLIYYTNAYQQYLH